MPTYFNWKTLFAFIALIIVSFSLYYSYNISKTLQEEEKKKVNIWANTLVQMSKSASDDEIEFLAMILSSNNTIPAIIQDSKSGEIVAKVNLDTSKSNDNLYLNSKIAQFKNEHEPIKLNIQNQLTQMVYYGDSSLLKKLKYYPFVQLGIISVFLLILILLLRNDFQSTQNKLWLGMSKETAHQLGTPLSSLQGWIEILKDEYPQFDESQSMEKDISRLKMVVDRFSKIGSKPTLEETQLVPCVLDQIEYMKKRSSKNINFNFSSSSENILASLNPPLFNWVVENLIRNAIDSMNGKGDINIRIQEFASYIDLEIQDTGSGILKRNFKKIFKPGFSTKKRGWGIGLALTKRIIKDFHKGSIYVKESEIGKGTTFKIQIKKQSLYDVKK